VALCYRLVTFLFLRVEFYPVPLGAAPEALEGCATLARVNRVSEVFFVRL
jgi:hypothetical protein